MEISDREIILKAFEEIGKQVVKSEIESGEGITHALWKAVITILHESDTSTQQRVATILRVTNLRKNFQ